MREYFLKTKRIGFSRWSESDRELAALLWGEPEVTRYICASGVFSEQDITDRLQTEIANGREYHVQYWPFFERATGEFLGCCGLRPHGEDPAAYETGFHLRREYWGRGYALEAAQAVIGYGFSHLKAEKIFAGHHPDNKSSKKLLMKLGFTYTGDEYYEPTGLYHPSYILETSFYNNGRRMQRSI